MWMVLASLTEILGTHIWTFAAALAENMDHSNALVSTCPCISRSALDLFLGLLAWTTSVILAFRHSIVTGSPPEFLGDDPLWDGEGCEAPNTCCSFNTPPWFYKQLPQPTTDDIEMRVCRDEERQ